ncbi:hypothetical protein [Emticicia sp. BO119]|uniref:hypothetical protein n=1 Tax=Emticicia sp. BO119 TaxID=2757768 RepID=UPI0015F0088D|nr:hypothetical protein [Emticicia sp. BO119]MBA4850753.1 hypothetical protein [Emticicia sp. BO119]
MKTKLYISLSVLFLLCSELKAQDYNAEESISSQITNNRIPGALYAPVRVSNKVTNKDFEGSSLAKAFLEGKAEGLKFIFTPISATTDSTINAIKPLGLASEVSASEAKATFDKTVKETQLKPILPDLLQEEKKE